MTGCCMARGECQCVVPSLDIHVRLMGEVLSSCSVVMGLLLTGSTGQRMASRNGLA